MEHEINVLIELPAKLEVIGSKAILRLPLKEFQKLIRKQEFEINWQP